MNWLALAILVAPTVLLAEVFDFEAAELGSVPGDWALSMTNEGGAPRWEIVHDPTSPGGAKVLAQLSDDPVSARFPLAIYQNAVLVNGEIRVLLKPISGRIDRSAGLVWRYIDENNYYVVRANALEHNVVLYKVENGRRSSLSPIGHSDEYGIKHTVSSERWSTLGLSFDGPRFTVFFNGQELFQVEDPTFSGAGRVGLWTKADSVTHFDDFEIVQR